MSRDLDLLQSERRVSLLRNEIARLKTEAERSGAALAALTKLRATASELYRAADSLSDCIAEFCDTGVEKTCACKACGEHMQLLDVAAERVRLVLAEIQEEEP